MSTTLTPPNQSKQVFISLGIIIVLLIAGFALLRTGHSEEPEAAATSDQNNVTVSSEGTRIANIKTARVEMGEIQDRLVTTGLISYPADQTVKIAPRLQGRVRQIYVKVGDRVHSGETLAVLDSVDAATAETTALQNDNKLRLARINLDRYEQLYKLGTPEVTSAQAALDQAEVGAQAAKDVLAHVKYQSQIGSFADKPLEDADNAVVTASAALSQAQSDLSLAQKDYDRKKQLVEIGIAAQSDLEISQDTLEKAKANTRADQDALRLAEQASKREHTAYSSHLYDAQQIEQASSAYRQAVLQRNAAQTALNLAKAQVTRDLAQARSDYQAAVFDAQNAHHTLDILGNPSANGTVPIRSPIDGVVTERDVSPGQVVDQSQMTPWQMFVVSNPDTVWVDADVFEKDIANVRIGSPVQIRVAAAGDQVFQGSVLRIAPTLDKTSRAIKVRAEINNRSGRLLDGEFADVTLPLGAPHRGLVVPMSAIEHEGDTDFVYRANGDKYTKTQVKLGVLEGQKCEIVSGVKPGDRIATEGAIFLAGQISDD